MSYRVKIYPNFSKMRQPVKLLIREKTDPKFFRKIDVFSHLYEGNVKMPIDYMPRCCDKQDCCDARGLRKNEAARKRGFFVRIAARSGMEFLRQQRCLVAYQDNS